MSRFRPSINKYKICPTTRGCFHIFMQQSSAGHKQMAGALSNSRRRWRKHRPCRSGRQRFADLQWKGLSVGGSQWRLICTAQDYRTSIKKTRTINFFHLDKNLASRERSLKSSDNWWRAKKRSRQATWWPRLKESTRTALLQIYVDQNCLHEFPTGL